ncbi:ABC transporter permease [Microbacterium paludicola]|uniref:ABC transporter permease n=1 Tax=Microbacterium paludicola TaxID=300019 RepID=A0A4Y9FS92_9MICO|nr:ABC transporter permease [Microbacterium paludicola]MBF0817169.1 ABC transporter permease [Microbacterium paludicola]TFU32097.1 ABC transporter permease [Microbacterium paludicola]
MIKRIGLQIGGALLTLVLASVLSFVILRMLPGDPARLIVGPLASDAAVEAMRVQLGVEQPIFQQYASYIGGFLTGQWGFSYSNGADVATVISMRLPATLELAIFAFVFAVAGALVVATLATYLRSWAAGLSKTLALVGLGTPPFWLALVLILVFAVNAGVLPGPEGRLSRWLAPPPFVTGLYTIDALLAGDLVVLSDALAHLVLPAIALGAVPWAFLVRLLTANQLDVMSASFVVVVRSKGKSRWSAHTRHVVHNALLPTITSGGVILATLITSSVLIEQTFDWPGIGRVLVEGIQRQDFGIVQVFILLSAFIYVGANLVTDFILELVDPRLRVQRQGA